MIRGFRKIKKLNIVREFSEEILCGNGIYSFMNFASLEFFFLSQRESTIRYFCDGKLMALLCHCLLRNKVNRVSFDFTSIAETVFSRCVDQNKSVYFVGATKIELDDFKEKISKRFPKLKILGCCSGYFNDMGELTCSIVSIEPDVVVVSLGAGKQELFLESLVVNGFTGVGFSCGGFIRQLATSKRPNYYPSWVNKLNLRAFYRMVKEPHTIKRYLINYPINLMRLLYFIAVKKVKITG